jgi:hypothetical protein
LDGLTHLSPEVARGLASHNGDLHLRGVKEITADAARMLKGHKGSLFLHGVTSLSSAAASALAKHKGMLDLQGITHLSAEVGSALSKTKGYLNLRGLPDLLEEVAIELSKHHGELNLRGVVSVSSKIAYLFEDKTGKINGMNPLRWMIDVCPTFTRDPMLAATLMAFGITKSERFSLIPDDDSKAKHKIWFFTPKTDEEQVKAEKIVKAWGNSSWHLANDKHPLTFVKRALAYYEQLIPRETSCEMSEASDGESFPVGVHAL